MPVQDKLTRGDQSPEAAGGAQGEIAVDLTTIASATPSGWRQDVDKDAQKISPPGDSAAEVQNFLGAAEEVLNPLEKAENAYRAYRLSPFLETIIQAFIVNVYGADFAFKPILNVFDRKDRERLRANLEYEKAQGDLDQEVEISDEELDAAVEQYSRRATREQIFLKAWFRHACTDMTYQVLRILTGQDRHIHGNAYWEVTRDDKGKPKHLVHAPAWSIRAKKLGPYFFCNTLVRDTDIGEWRDEAHPKRFRGYVQLDKNNNVVARYKEFGDPRVMSRTTGKYYETIDDMNEAEVQQIRGSDGKTVLAYPYPATELLHFKIPYAGSSAYGKPRWSSVYPDLVGMRDLAEHNRRIVTDSEIPNILMLLAGARVDKDSEARVREQIEERGDGPKGIMLLQAYHQAQAPTGSTQHAQIEVVKLRDAMHQDGLGQKYAQGAYKRSHLSYRVPRVILGDDEGINRSAAFGMFRLAEDQVWDPERDEFDDQLNAKVLPELDIRTVAYATQGRTPKDPELLSKIISQLADAGVLTPDEGRDLSEQIFNRDFRDLEGLWSRMPRTILNAILQTKNQVTAAAVLASEGAQEDMLTRLREAVLEDFQRAGVKFNVQGNKDGATSADTGGGGEPGGVAGGGEPR
jgi:capsid portal protein